MMMIRKNSINGISIPEMHETEEAKKARLEKEEKERLTRTEQFQESNKRAAKLREEFEKSLTK